MCYFITGHLDFFGNQTNVEMAGWMDVYMLTKSTNKRLHVSLADKVYVHSYRQRVWSDIAQHGYTTIPTYVRSSENKFCAN